ncbi:MAG: restriction endonuclease subunit S [Clostridia bacterium]|nr:restriction endonuclease subunit S [Clostridia bacterium]
MKPEIKERIEMINRGEVPEGYKRKELDIVMPEDWDLKHLKNVINNGIKNGIFNDPRKVGCGVKLINVINLYKEPYIKTDNLTYLNVQPEELKKYRVEKGDVLFTRSSLKLEGIAYCNINMNETEDLVYDCHIIKVSPNKVILDPQYFRSFCLIHISRKYFMKNAKQTTMTTIGQNEIAKLPVLLPPLAEQQKIASILSTWDKAIELKERLIEQKKYQKRGLMQKLLTGKVRLPGFKGKWKEVELGSVLRERKDTGYDNLELLAITSKNGVVRRTEIDIKDNSSEDKSKYKRICPLDIGYNTMRMWQGVSGVSEYEGIVSPAYTILKPTDRVNSYFMGYLFKLPKTINLFWRYSQGLVDDTLSLKYPNFKKIKVIIPVDVKEQESIAGVFKHFDKQLQLLEQELDLLRQQKKGLMQLLLTGKVRV